VDNFCSGLHPVPREVHSRRPTRINIRDTHGHISTLHTTTEHLFWDDTLKTWVAASQLTPGHALEKPAGGHAYVASLHTVPGSAYRYNLTVQQLHAYYVLAGATPILVHNTSECGPQISSHYEKAGDLGKYTEGQATRDPASQWYHEYLSNDELLDGINNADEGDGILVSQDDTILGGHHRWDELLARVADGRLDPDTLIRIDVYGGE
jgi:hypothetical protein